MEVATMSANEYADVISLYHKAVAEKPDAGFLSRSQWEDKWKKGTTETTRTITKLMKAGLMEVRKYKIITLTRGLYPTPHYKLIKK
jgi:Mn-dependent DtxR family transcriptional regulator